MTMTQATAPAPTSTPPEGLVRLGTTPGTIDYLKALWVRREFALAIPAAQLRAQHRNTILGGLWHLLNPLFQMTVYFLIFGVLLEVNRGVENFLGFLAVGVFTFHFTTKSVTSGAKSITNNEGLIRAIMFPRAILPVAAVLSEFASFGYAFLTMIAVLLMTGETISWIWLIVVPIVGLQLLFNTGLAMFVARISDHFPDFQQVLPFMLRLWLYMSGIIWPAARLIDSYPDLAWLLQLNPAYVFVELMRAALLDNSVGPTYLWLSASVWAVLAILIGFSYFRAREIEYGRG